jgi:hypothetical protein
VFVLHLPDCGLFGFGFCLYVARTARFSGCRANEGALPDLIFDIAQIRPDTVGNSARIQNGERNDQSNEHQRNQLGLRGTDRVPNS